MGGKVGRGGGGSSDDNKPCVVVTKGLGLLVRLASGKVAKSPTPLGVRQFRGGGYHRVGGYYQIR